MIIEIRGVQFENKGAQLMLHTALQQISTRLPTAQIALRLNAGTTRRDLASAHAMLKLPLRKQQIDLNKLSYHWPQWINRSLQRHGLITEARIDAVLDASGFAYGDRWGAGALQASAAELKRFYRYGKPYIFLPQAYGPFETTRTAAMIWANALQHASLVAVRDAESEKQLRTLAPTARNIKRYPDITIGLDVPSNIGKQSPAVQPQALLIPNIRILEKISEAAYLALLHNMASQVISAGYRIRVLNHGGKEDDALCRKVNQRVIDNAQPVIEHHDPRVLKAAIGANSLVISSRFHACIAALSQGVPCVAIAWTHKYRELFESFSCAEYVFDVSQTIPTLPNIAASVELLRSAATQQKTQLVELWDEVFRLLKA